MGDDVLKCPVSHAVNGPPRSRPAVPLSGPHPLVRSEGTEAASALDVEDLVDHFGPRRGSARSAGSLGTGVLFCAECRPSPAVYRHSPKAVTLLFTSATGSYLWATVDNQPGPRWR